MKEHYPYFLISNDPDDYWDFQRGFKRNDPRGYDNDEYVRFVVTYPHGNHCPDQYTHQLMPLAVQEQVGEINESRFEFKGSAEDLVKLLQGAGYAVLRHGKLFTDREFYQLKTPEEPWFDVSELEARGHV